MVRETWRCGRRKSPTGARYPNTRLCRVSTLAVGVDTLHLGAWTLKVLGRRDFLNLRLGKLQKEMRGSGLAISR